MVVFIALHKKFIFSIIELVYNPKYGKENNQALVVPEVLLHKVDVLA